MISYVTTHPYIGARQSIFLPPKPLRYRELCFLQNSSLRSSPSSEMEPTAAKVSISPALMMTSGASSRVNAMLSLRLLRAVVVLLHGFFLLLVVPFRRRRQPSYCIEKEKANKQALPLPAATVQQRSPVAEVALRELVPAATVQQRSPVAEVALRELDVAARRAVAIGRVGQGANGERLCEFPDVFRVVESRYLVHAVMDTSLCYERIGYPVMFPRGLVILLHGLDEHSGRYNDFAKQLNANGYKVYGMDWIGHGGSDGLHGHVHSLDDAVSDTKAFIKKVLAENSGYPGFLFGHSTGAAIVLKAVRDPKIEAPVDGMVFTLPAIRVQPSHPIFLAPSEQGPVLRFSALSSYMQKNINRISVPFLVLHGSADTVTDPKASQKLYKEASSMEKSIKLYEGFLHDLFEPEHEEIMKDILNWLNGKLANF